MIREFLHDLIYEHPLQAKLGVGVIHGCINRFTGRVNCMVWYPEGYKEKIDITYIDLEEFFLCSSVAEAIQWVE